MVNCFVNCSFFLPLRASLCSLIVSDTLQILVYNTLLWLYPSPSHDCYVCLSTMVIIYLQFNYPVSRNSNAICCSIILLRSDPYIFLYKTNTPVLLTFYKSIGSWLYNYYYNYFC